MRFCAALVLLMARASAAYDANKTLDYSSGFLDTIYGCMPPRYACSASSHKLIASPNVL